MRSETFDFDNGRGERLSARLDRPDGRERAVALFAHCFTCDKTSKAAAHIARALADQGVAVLRFDFTGLGESEGAFGARGFSADVDDVAAAAAALAAKGCPPSLLIGHSLGGAAVLAAAADIASAKAVVTIGAPSDPAHVLRQLGDDRVRRIEADGQAEVDIGGRPFKLSQAFLDDARLRTLSDRVPHLGRALLIMHAPLDPIVGIENATAIFLAARHPKSFVSLDDADHLLTRTADADYVAGVVAAWAARYIKVAPDQPAEAADGAVMLAETGASKFQIEVSVRGTHFVADEPADVGGGGTGPTPYELLCAGLGACTCMTVRLYADMKGWPLERARASVRHEKVEGRTPADVFHRALAFEGALSDTQRAKLLDIANRCPVHRTLETGSSVETTTMAAAVPHADPAVVAETADEHFRDMRKACED